METRFLQFSDAAMAEMAIPACASRHAECMGGNALVTLSGPTGEVFVKVCGASSDWVAQRPWASTVRGNLSVVEFRALSASWEPDE